MTRTLWIIALVVVVVMVAGMAAAGFGYLAYRQHQTKTWHADADRAFDEGDWRTAQRWYEYYLNRQPDDIEALDRYITANMNQEEGRTGALNRALTGYFQMLRHKPGNVEIQNTVLRLYEQMQSWNNLEYYVNDFLRDRADDPLLKSSLALALKNLNRGAEAAPIYQQLADAKTADAGALFEYADLLRDRQEPDRALDVLDQALELYDDKAPVRLARAQYFVESAQWDLAEPEIAEAERLSPDNAEVSLLKARLALSQFDYEAATANAARATELDPEYAPAYVLQAHALAQSGQGPEAVALLQSVPPLIRASNPELYFSLAEMVIAERDYEAAEEVIERYQQAYPEAGSIIDYLRARILLAQDKQAEAIDMLRQVTMLRSDFEPARFYLALAYLADGQDTLGRSTLEAYLSRNPTDQRAQALLNQQAGVQLPASEIAAQAEKMIGDKTLSADLLVSTALNLARADLVRGTPDAHLELLQQLFDQAVSNEPRSSRNYRVISDVYCILGQPVMARQALGRAESAGIPGDQLSLAIAQIDLAEGNPDAARARAKAQTEPTAASWSQWANLFVQWGYPAEAAALLDEAALGMESEDLQTLQIARIEALVRAGQPGDARALCDTLDQELPAAGELREGLVRGRMRLAMYLVEETDPPALDEASAQLDKLKAWNPDAPETLTLEARLALAENPTDTETPSRLLERASENNPNNPDTLVGLSQVAMAMGETARAVELMNRAVGADPARFAYRLQLAEMNAAAGRHDEARATLRSMLSVRPGYRRASELLVASLIATGETDEAQQALDGLVQSATDPSQQSRLASLRGRLELVRGDAAQAESLLREQVGASPGDLAMVRSLAASMAAQERFEEGAAELRKFAESQPDSPEAWLALARYHMALVGPGQAAAASDALSRALLANPEYLPALREQAELQFRQGNLQGALALCDRCLEREPGDSRMQFLKARILSSLRGREPEAMMAVNRAVEITAQPEFLYLRGLLHLRSGSYPDAVTDLANAREGYSPPPGNLEMAMARAQFGVGRTDLARYHFEQAQDREKEGEQLDPQLREELTQLIP